MRRWLAPVGLSFALACSAPAREPSATPDPEPETRTAVEAPPPPVLPAVEEATASTFVVVNRRAAPITLVTSVDTFRLERRAGEPESMRIGGFGPLVAGPSCECRCGFECLQCEPPRYEERAIPPGESVEMIYSGRVRVWAYGCFEPYALPPGPRRFTACLEGAHLPDADCVSVEVEHPTARVEYVFVD